MRPRVQDAHAGNATNGSAALGISGTTRLAFSSAADGKPVAVSGLSSPITFTLPASAGVNNETQAQCVFWSDAAGAYSTAGCAALPNPLPCGLAAYWLPNATVSGPPGLAATWDLRDDGSGAGAALLAGCGMVYLNCSDPAQVNVSVFPNPRAPLSVPSVSCGGALSARLLRVYNGTACGLISNPVCYWNQTAQAFSGPGCAAANSTGCACLHLTDFASQGAPKISVCSASDLTAVTPNDIITKRVARAPARDHAPVRSRAPRVAPPAAGSSSSCTSSARCLAACTSLQPPPPSSTHATCAPP